MDWHLIKFLESSDNLKPLIKKRFGREPNTSLAREIIACLQQGRLFYEAAERAPLEIAPLQLFYGMVGFSKALILASSLKSISALKPAHGIIDVSQQKSRISDLTIKIGESGTFQEFNDFVAPLCRVCYTDYRSTERRTVHLRSAASDDIRGLSINLEQIFARIPGLESLYALTFGRPALTAPYSIATPNFSTALQIQINDTNGFGDRDSLKRIVDHWRDRFPMLRMWRVAAAQYQWRETSILFENHPRAGNDELSSPDCVWTTEGFERQFTPDDAHLRFGIKEGFNPTAGYLMGGSYLIAPLNGIYLSDFSLQYLALFLLSSLVRYADRAIACAQICGLHSAQLL